MTIAERSFDTAIPPPECILPISPESFMASIKEPLDLFGQTIQDFHTLDETTTGPQGTAAKAARKISNLMIETINKKDVTGLNGLYVGLAANAIGTSNTRKNEERYIRDITKRVVDYIEDGIETDKHNPYEYREEIVGKPLTAKEKQAFEELSEEITQIRVAYSKGYAKLGRTWSEQGDQVLEALAAHAGAHFQNFITLIKYLQGINMYQNATLARLFAHAEQESQESIKKALENVRHQEEQQPTPETLFQFFTSIAKKYYQNGQRDELWAGISIMLGESQETLRETFADPENNQNQDEILAPVIDSIMRNGLPPAAANRYQLFLSEQQATSWHYLIQRGSTLNEKDQFKTNNNHAPEAITWSQRKKNKQANIEPKNDEPEQAKEILTPQRLIIFLHKDMTYIAESEEELAEHIRKFFAEKVKEYNDSDIEAYSMILAKKAGWRKNAPGHKEEKIKGIDKITFTTRDQQEKVPFFILRRLTNSAPRIGVAYPKGFVALVTAWDREDNSYNVNRDKFAYETITLPTLPRPTP